MKILYFASLREQIGIESENWSNSVTIFELKQQLNKKYNTDVFNNILCAVNLELVNDKYTIKTNDEIAFYPPVTGG